MAPPASAIRVLYKKALAVAGVVTHPRDFLPFFLASPNSGLGRQLRMRPELWGIAVTPFVCADWSAPERIRTLVQHCRTVDRLPATLSRAMETEVDLVRLEQIGPAYRLVLHQVDKLLREGLLTLSLFDGPQRLFTLSFTIAGDPPGSIVYVGGLQGIYGAAAQDRYREMTKATYGLRPRDLLIEFLCALSRQLGVARIMAVSDERHMLNSEYSLRNLAIYAARRHLNYNDTWLERGGHRLSTSFFELPVALHRRAPDEIPARKRKLYASRYRLLDLWERELACALGASPALGGADLALWSETEALSRAQDSEQPGAPTEAREYDAGLASRLRGHPEAAPSLVARMPGA